MKEIVKTAVLAEGLKRPGCVVFVTLLITGISCVESWRGFLWSPFLHVHTLCLFVLPVLAKSYDFGTIKRSFANWKPILVGLLGIKIWQLAYQLVYDFVLRRLDVVGSIEYDLFRASGEILNQTATKYGSVSYAIVLMALTVLVIPVAEEFYYRGYVFGVLRHSKSFLFSAVVSSLLLALRHFAHLLFLSPFPIVPASLWVVSVFPTGILAAYIYEKTNSLYPVILVHVLLNVPVAPR